jgi:hypothetical protein
MDSHSLPPAMFLPLPDYMVDRVFPRLVAQYRSAYDRWQSQPLIDRLSNAIRGLMIARTLVPADEPHDSPVMQEFAAKIELLRAKMADLGGEAALANFDQGI